LQRIWDERLQQIASQLQTIVVLQMVFMEQVQDSSLVLHLLHSLLFSKTKEIEILDHLLDIQEVSQSTWQLSEHFQRTLVQDTLLQDNLSPQKIPARAGIFFVIKLYIVGNNSLYFLIWKSKKTFYNALHSISSSILP
jgi:hypothetical protein